MSVIDICFRVIIKPFLKLPFFPNFIGRKFLSTFLTAFVKSSTPRISHAFKYNPNSSLNMLISIVDANVTLCVVISGARNVFSGEVEGAVT